MVDEFQGTSPWRVASLVALCKQNSQTILFAVGNDWQTAYRFNGIQLPPTTAFQQGFSEDDDRDLDTIYRFSSHTGEVANQSIQQNPHQLTKLLNSLMAGDRKAATLFGEG